MERTRDKIQQLASSEHEAAFEIAARRWLEADPEAGPEIARLAHKTKWLPKDGAHDPRLAGPSTELLMVWAKADLQGMIRRADSLNSRKDDLGLEVRGFLMSRINARTRNRWLAEATTDEPADDVRDRLHSEWARWQPDAALESAMAMNDLNVVSWALVSACDGPWYTTNSRHAGFRFFKQLDVERLEKRFGREVLEDFLMYMEGWGELDLVATARYGLDWLLRVGDTPRDKLLAFFSGEDIYPDSGDVVDRTFCALRVWAVVQPKEMKAWIATLPDKEMREALPWLLEHPGGQAADGTK